MSKRKYTKMQELEAEIMCMREARLTLHEIAVHFGLEKRQLENLVNRRNCRQRKLEAGIMPRPKPNSRARLVDFLTGGVKTVTVARRPFEDER